MLFRSKIPPPAAVSSGMIGSPASLQLLESSDLAHYTVPRILVLGNRRRYPRPDFSRETVDVGSVRCPARTVRPLRGRSTDCILLRGRCPRLFNGCPFRASKAETREFVPGEKCGLEHFHRWCIARVQEGVQSPLRGCVFFLPSYPGLASWATVNRPCGAETETLYTNRENGLESCAPSGLWSE